LNGLVWKSSQDYVRVTFDDARGLDL